jgi:putative endonuclease
MEPVFRKKSQNKETGAIGESIAATYYENQGFHIVGRNYLKKWGEIDVIAEKDHRIHFIEVKTVSYETKYDLNQAVTHGTWRPEENVHPYKLKKLARAIDSWLREKKWSSDWQIDVAAVRVVPRETYATIKIIPNIILD